VNSSVILTGIARCGACGSLLHRQTGKGGRYTYYRCSGRMRKGSCEGGEPAGISGPLLDRVVLNKLLDELLTPQRVQAIVAEVAVKRLAGAEQAVTSLAQMEAQRSKTRKKLSKLMNALGEGVFEASETFKATVKAAEADCERLATMIAVQERLLDSRLKPITSEEATRVAAELRRKLLESDPSLQKRIVRSFIDKVVVKRDEIVITGAKSDLAEVVTGTPMGQYGPAASPVPSFERAWWRTQSQSNLSPLSNSLLTGKLTGNFRYYGANTTRILNSPRLFLVHG